MYGVAVDYVEFASGRNAEATVDMRFRRDAAEIITALRTGVHRGGNLGIGPLMKFDYSDSNGAG